MILRKLSKCILFIFLISCNESKKHYESAYSFYMNKNYKEALIEIEKAEKIESDNLEHKFLKSKIYTSLNRWNDAIILLKNLENSKYKLDTVYFTMGSAFFNLSRDARKTNTSKSSHDSLISISINYFDSAINYNKYYFDCYELKYKALHNTFKSEDALFFLNQSIEIFKDSIQFEMYRGVEKVMIGDYNGAILDLQKLIRDKSKSIDFKSLSTIYRFLGASYFKKNDLDASIFNYSLSIKYDSTFWELYSERGEAYFLKNKKDSACINYRKSADLGNINAYQFIIKNCQ